TPPPAGCRCVPPGQSQRPDLSSRKKRAPESGGRSLKWVGIRSGPAEGREKTPEKNPCCTVHPVERCTLPVRQPAIVAGEAKAEQAIQVTRITSCRTG